ncbi:hypothetical protein [Catelliglobosispora koreensis]|uniref:hypothetical protein n=1 Tax=Catelliglobosispora koreensis TaxID=129052 RepID=UPI00037399AB|nr:hypothetical protein [Catelliglobosispora koreensis]
MTSYTAEPIGQRPRPGDQMEALFSDGWPKFISADEEVKLYFARIRELFGDLELVLLDDSDVLVAAGWAVPIQWDETIEDLPTGYTNSLARALKCYDAGAEPDTLVMCAAQIHPGRRGKGIASELLTALKTVAGGKKVIAPVRPTLKSSYPLTPIERFARWTRPDGTAMDPWIRTHERMGARILAPAPRSQVMTATVAQWQEWTGLAFPESGTYVIPDGLSTLAIDIDADLGTYVEPNVWMRHQ